MNENFTTIDATSPPTKLQEAIEEVKRERRGVDFSGYEYRLLDIPLPTAIATILNAVVKGELKHE